MMNKFKAGDEVRRIAESYGEVVKGDIYTVVRVFGSTLKLEDCLDLYGSVNFELVVEPVSIQTEQEIVTDWLDKLAYVLLVDPTTADFLEIRNKGLLLESDVTNITGSADIYQYVENTYDQLKSQEIQKKSQKLLEQKEQLAKQLADIEKELESLK
jgi:hypothetical protein